VDFDTASRSGEPFVKMLDYFAEYRKQEKGLPMWLPNFSNNACTAYLKIKIGEKHMCAVGYDEWDCVIGIRKDEPGRYHRMMAANAKGGSRWESVCPSYTAGIIKEDVAEFWLSQDFDLGIDSHLGNCDLCWKKGEDKLFKAIQAEPERVIFWSGLVWRRSSTRYSVWIARNTPTLPGTQKTTKKRWMHLATTMISTASAVTKCASKLQ
jgi:3'-phosphoadenosine 5'-phosphosulfate sulfotransferase (PAPS reductase)/FAD synthetase